MFPEPTELNWIGWLIESIWTQNPNQIHWHQEPTRRHFDQSDEWNHLWCLFNISRFSSTNCSEVMSKKTQEDASEGRVTAKSKPKTSLVSRCSAKDLNVLASIASESRGETKSESPIPLSSWNEQQARTKRLVMDASSSKYSEWNIDDKWSSEEWKSGEMLGARTGRLVGGQESTQETDKFVIDDDDDMDCDTVAESDMSLKSRSFLHRVNDRVRKILDQSSKDAIQDNDKHLWKGEWLCLLHCKHLYSWERITQKIYAPLIIQWKISRRNRCLTFLKSW